MSSSFAMNATVHNALFSVKSNCTDDPCIMHHMNDDIEAQAARLRQARIDKGLETIEDAAARFGWNKNTYAQHENGTRGFRKNYRQYARAFGVSETWLWFGTGQKEAPLDGLPVVGVICAGNWLDTTLIDDDPNTTPETIPVASDGRFPYAKQYALRVQGDSMDKEFCDGSYVICVEFFDSGLAMKDDMIVHVERWQHGLREVTLKALKRDGEKWRLEPRSSNPAHKPILMNGVPDDGTEIRIRGVVIGDYRKRTI